MSLYAACDALNMSELMYFLFIRPLRHCRRESPDRSRRLRQGTAQARRHRGEDGAAVSGRCARALPRRFRLLIYARLISADIDKEKTIQNIGLFRKESLNKIDVEEKNTLPTQEGEAGVLFGGDPDRRADA